MLFPEYLHNTFWGFKPKVTPVFSDKLFKKNNLYVAVVVFHFLQIFHNYIFTFLLVFTLGLWRSLC